MAEVEILLATYNGARFLPELLASLDAQTDQNWRILVRDDGSSDETAAIVQAWGEGLGERFRRIEDDRGNLGAVGNFNALLEASTARYFLPCDQDDVWLPDKIARLTRAIRDEEGKMGANRPIIVHTDLIVVDEQLNEIAASFWRYQRLRLNPPSSCWRLITLQNNVTGCAMIGNRALARGASPVPDVAMMHDWWLALYASLKGQVIELAEPSIRYRQHGSNTLGAKQWSAVGALELLVKRPLHALKEPKRVILATQAQAREMVERHGAELDSAQCDFLGAYSGLHDRGVLHRKLFPLRNDLWYRGLLRNVALYAAI